MHAHTARRLTRRAQIAAGALFVGAGALVLMPVGAAEPTPEDSILTPLAKGGPRAKPADPLPDAAEIAAALDKVAPPVPKTEPPVAVKPDETKTDKNGTGEKPANGPWRYIGSVTNANFRRAIIVLNNEQKLVAEGEKIEGATLTSIAADHLMLRTGDTDRRVDLAPRQTTGLQIVNANPRAGQATPPSNMPVGDDEEAKLKMARYNEAMAKAGRNGKEAKEGKPLRNLPPSVPGREAEALGAESAGQGEQPGKEDK